MQRRIPFSTREVAGATLTISTMGGYSVIVEDDYIGYIHAAEGGVFNAYRRVPDQQDTWLGKFAEEDAVRAILGACGRALAEAA